MYKQIMHACLVIGSLQHNNFKMSFRLHRLQKEYKDILLSIDFDTESP